MPVCVASFRLHAVDAIANKCHSLWRRTPPRASGMLTIIKAGCDWFSRLRTAGSHAATRVGVVVMATTTGLRMGGFASSLPAALSSRSSGYCERCTLPLKLGRLSRMARIQGGIGGSLPAARTARRAVLARMRRIFEGWRAPKLIFFSVTSLRVFLCGPSNLTVSAISAFQASVDACEFETHSS